MTRQASGPPANAGAQPIGPATVSAPAGLSPSPQAGRQALCAALATLLGMSLVFPPAAISVMLALALMLALVRAPIVWAQRPWRHPVVATGLILLAWTAIHTLAMAGSADAPAWQAINKYHELVLPLVLLPLFARFLGDRAFLRGLAAGCLVYAALHWAALLSPPLADYLLPRRIAAGWTLALSAFIFLLWAPRMPAPAGWRALSVVLVITVLVAVGGRTGHLVVVALMALASALLAPRGWRLAATAAVTALLVMVAALSPQVGQRVQETLAGSATLDGQPLTATGIRIQLLRTAGDLLLEHPLLGVGHAGYAAAHGALARRRLAAEPQGAAYLDDAWVHSSNPHNEFLMQWLGGGLPAFCLFIGWLATIGHEARQALQRVPSPAVRSIRPIVGGCLAGLLLAFVIGGLFNSLLRDFTEGHYFAVILSWLLARARAA